MFVLSFSNQIRQRKCPASWQLILGFLNSVFNFFSFFGCIAMSRFKTVIIFQYISATTSKLSKSGGVALSSLGFFWKVKSLRFWMFGKMRNDSIAPESSRRTKMDLIFFDSKYLSTLSECVSSTECQVWHISDFDLVVFDRDARGSSQAVLLSLDWFTNKKGKPCLILQSRS